MPRKKAAPGRCLMCLWLLLQFVAGIIVMNFDKQVPVDTLLGRLLAFVIMFQKRIQFLKCKLAGNEEFHTRLAFQKMDARKNNQISAEDVFQALRSAGNAQSEGDCHFFIRRYSKNSGLAYEEFLKLITPKGNKVLAQRIMIRTYKKGALLEEYLFKTLLQLTQLYVKMSVITEGLRKAIQKNEDLSHLEIIQFFHLRISTPQHLISFLNKCDEDGQEYDITPADAVFLSYHIKSANELAEFTDLDIKELICPIDMSFQKGVLPRDTFFRETNYSNDNKYQTKGANFLGKTYQKLYQQPIPTSVKSSLSKQGAQPLQMTKKNQNIPQYIPANTNRLSSRAESLHQQSYGGLYIDNFARSDIRSNIQINKYVERHMRKPKDDVVVFQDDLSNRSSVSRGSAFDQS